MAEHRKTAADYLMGIPPVFASYDPSHPLMPKACEHALRVSPLLGPWKSPHQRRRASVDAVRARDRYMVEAAGGIPTPQFKLSLNA